MVGAGDDPRGFRPELHPLVADQARRRPHARFGAGRSVWDAVVPTVLGQRVTTREARHSWRQLVRRHGIAAPGTDAVRLAPPPARLLALGDADWHVLGVERRRADAVRAVARTAAALERAARAGSAELQRVLLTLPGIGPWSATGLAISVLGDPDTVLVGDLHVPHTVCHALAGEARGTDERMLELLAPWTGHRGRVVRLVKGAGRGAPRRGPRYTPIPIARW
jgi:3-methyladenine DNA glycosylase/8-oxoguanine DNA glycosylase